MNNHALVTVLAIPLLLAACSVGYQARGSLSDVPGERRGKGYPGNSGGGRFALGDPEGRLTCDGQTLPPVISPNPGSCAGEAGTGGVRCSDGREIPMRWEAITCRSWKGSGVDARTEIGSSFASSAANIQKSRLHLTKGVISDQD